MQFSKSLGLLLLGVLKRLWWLAPSLFTDPFDFMERWFKVMYQPPPFLFWLLLSLGLGMAIALTYHDLRMQKDTIERKLKEKEYKNFSVAWVNGKSWLRTPSGRTEFWEDESDGLSLLLWGHVSVTTIGTIQVESVTLDMGGQSYVCNWPSEGFYTSEERDVEFEIPLDTPRGKRAATLKAIVDGQPYISKSFTLDLPEGKQVFRIEDSQP